MKYLKLYEEFGPLSNRLGFSDWFAYGITFDYWYSNYGIYEWVDLKPEQLKDINLNDRNLSDLIGIDKYPNLEILRCGGNKLKSLKGIENLTKLKIINCTHNKLKNLNEIKNLKQLTRLISYTNPFEEPIPIEIVDKFGADKIYGVDIHKINDENVNRVAEQKSILGIMIRKFHSSFWLS